MSKPRAPREAPPPTRFGKSAVFGTYFEIRGGRHRDARGRKLYRLFYVASGVLGTQQWTLDELVATGVKFLKRLPSAARSQ